ncbi:tetratricopeptide repeat protein [Aquincola sp. MAHUQ-54]|uniref:Tetratricopeptide repeat protein n=1 Tax=Aquincola agrisoli TaxID=3119538 RepID=A0AAW9QR92_9BURK
MTPPDAAYNLQSIEAMLGMRRGVVARLVSAGFVSPSRGPRNEYRFTFRDVVLLRTAQQLQAANVPRRRLLRSLRQLRARLPSAVPLSGLRIRAIGDTVAVHDGSTPWEPESGQLLIDFEVSAGDGSVSFIDGLTAEGWFRRGESQEGADPSAAMQCYRRALELSPDLAAAYVNLGALLCEAGHCEEALALYERAAEWAPDDPRVHFNGALALEDLGMDRDAIRSYERCLVLAPYLADAHYNAARLFDRIGDRQAMLRHLNAYRRLQGGEVPGA